MKFDNEHTQIIIDALKDGQGRVNACKMADISYETFMRWMKNESEFCESIKEAERDGNDKIKDIQKRKILDNEAWQSGAWWLERTYPEEFKNKQEVEVKGPIQINISKDEAGL